MDIQTCDEHGPFIDWCDDCVTAAIADLPPEARAFVEAERAAIEAGRGMRLMVGRPRLP